MPPWLMMMDDSAPTQERRKMVKIHETVFAQKHTVAAKICWKIKKDEVENGHRC